MALWCGCSSRPPGTCMGAYQDGLTPVAEASWGRIKEAFAATPR